MNSRVGISSEEMLRINASNSFGMNAAHNDNTARSYAFRRAGNTLALRVNGSVVATMIQVLSPDVSAPGQVVEIGAVENANAVQFIKLDGDIAELIACKAAIAPKDLAGVEAYLQAKYNFTFLLVAVIQADWRSKRVSSSSSSSKPSGATRDPVSRGAAPR